MATVATYGRANETVQVETYNSTGYYENASFTLAVVCSAPLWGVVESSGELDRGSATSSAWISTGSYEVSFGTNVLDCAYLVTPGDPGTSAPSPPSWSGITPRNLNVDALFVDLYSPVGEYQDDSFHVAAFC